MRTSIKSLRASSISRSFQVLDTNDQRKIWAVTFLQLCIGILDLLGVLAIGLLGALAVTGLESGKPGNRISAVLRLLHISRLSFQTQAAILGLGAVILLVGRTIFSIYFTRRILFFLSRRGAAISSDLIARLLSQPLLVVQSRTTQETLYTVTRGVEAITVNVLATSVVLIADFSLLFVMTIGLFIVDATTAVGTLLIFSIIGYSLHRLMNVRAGALGRKASQLNIVSNEKVVEVFSSYREAVVRNRRDYYAREIGRLRFNLADTMGEIYFMPFISKYVIETSVVLGALLLGGFQFAFQDTSHAVATLSIFLAAGTRIAPAVLRVQQGIIQIRNGLGVADSTLDLIESLSGARRVENVDDSVDLIHEGFVGNVEIEGVTLTYPGRNTPAIQNITLSITAGSSVAIVGSSGAGKTTLIDVLLGVLEPDEGSVRVSGLPPLEAVSKWPGAVSYVPQDVVISNGSVRENVAQGYPVDVASDELVSSALSVACMQDFVSDLEMGLDTPVGERGAKISGGQRQRLGIARAMFTRPHLLVLDEATSSLDGETEASISQAIHNLKGSTTVIMIAHRLSTVRNADMVVYLANGSIAATGTFDDVRAVVPDFDRQAKLMGL